MQICGFNKTTLLDYPKHLAATIFIGGCNYRCPFCHNGSLVTCPANQPALDEEEILSLLRKRKHILEGVCISGGEPTIHKELPEFIYKIKDIGLKVKLDSNGNNPSMINQLAESHLIDFIAMDIKNSKDNYSKSVGLPDFQIENVCESVSYIMSCGISYEFRTTVVRELHEREDFFQIGNWLRGADAYFLQTYKNSSDMLSSGYSAYPKETLEEFRDLLLPMIPAVSLRGID